MKKEVKPYLIIIVSILIQTLLYLISKSLINEPHILTSSFDDKIPFIIYSIIPYSLWYFLLFIIPIIFYKSDKNLFIKYILSFLLVTLLSNVIFVIYPTTIIRPNVMDGNIFHSLVQLIFSIDTPVLNCFPSIHCSVCFLWILYAFNNKYINYIIKILILFLSINIILSTLFIKQHVIIDVLGGILLSWIVYLIINKININKIKDALKM